MTRKYAVVKHGPNHDWVAEVLPSEAEANEWAEIFRERGEPDVTYTVEPLASVHTD